MADTENDEGQEQDQAMSELREAIGEHRASSTDSDDEQPTPTD